MAAAEYDDTNLYKLFEQLDPKMRKKALKGAFRRAANQVRRAAITNLKGTGINNADALSQGVRAVVFKRQAGFRVTVGSKKAGKNGKGERGMYKTRKQDKKPVLVWVEDGTAPRAVHSKKNIIFRSLTGRWFAAGRNRGRIKRYGFIARTASQMGTRVTDMLHKEIIDNIQRVAKKYGCK